MEKSDRSTKLSQVPSGERVGGLIIEGRAPLLVQFGKLLIRTLIFVTKHICQWWLHFQAEEVAVAGRIVSKYGLVIYVENP